MQQIILNYVPIVFATLLEPLWAMLCRTLCTLYPFSDLLREDRYSSQSIDLTYAPFPPQLILWRAFRARHFLLAAVSVITVSTNLLAVMLGSLFNVQQAIINHDFAYKPFFNPQFSGNFSGFGTMYIDDHLYIARANLTANTQLPPWITSDFFFIPVDLVQAPPASFHEVSTMGFGVESTCLPLNGSDPAVTINFTLSDDGAFETFSGSYNIDNGGDTILCGVDDVGQDYYGNFTMGTRMITSDFPQGSGPQVQAISLGMGPLNDSSTRSVSFCSRRMLFGWVHATFTQVPDGPEPDSWTLQRTASDVLFVDCQLALKVANFKVLTAANGQVLSYTQLTPFDANIDKYFVSNTNVSTLYKHMSIHLATTRDDTAETPYWRNDTTAPDWINYFIKIISDSTDLYDPRAPLTNLKFIPALESAHRLLFSILLSLYTELFVPAAQDETVPGKLFTSQSRVIMNTSSYIISIVILTMNLIVALVLYFNRPRKFLPRMPTSIGSIFGYIAASYALRDLRQQRPGQKYRFGRFLGTDGNLHAGIEKAEKVFPLPVNHRKNRLRRWLGMKSKAPPVPPKN